jgi:hypothetical protein
LQHHDFGRQINEKSKMSQAQDAEMTDLPIESLADDGLAPGEVEEESIEKLIRVVCPIALRPGKDLCLLMF